MLLSDEYRAHERPMLIFFVNSLHYPKLSIVTVTYNAAQVVRETLESVIGQTYPDIEYIIIDGESNDGTQDIIQ